MNIAKSVIADAGQKSSLPGTLTACGGVAAVTITDGGVLIWSQPANTTATNINVGFLELTVATGGVTSAVAFISSE